MLYIYITILFLLFITIVISMIHTRKENYRNIQHNDFDNSQFITGPGYVKYDNEPEYSEYNGPLNTYGEYVGCQKPYTPIYVDYDKNYPSTLPTSNKMFAIPEPDSSYVNLL